MFQQRAITGLLLNDHDNAAAQSLESGSLGCCHSKIGWIKYLPIHSLISNKPSPERIAG